MVGRIFHWVFKKQEEEYNQRSHLLHAAAWITQAFQYLAKPKLNSDFIFHKE